MKNTDMWSLLAEDAGAPELRNPLKDRIHSGKKAGKGLLARLFG